MKKKLILTVGMSCSGKTTWANGYLNHHALGSVWNLNRDDVRFHLFTDGEHDWSKYKFCNKNEKKVTEYIESEAIDAVQLGTPTILISDTNLNPIIRNKWKEFAETHGYEYEEKPFHITWEEARKRNNLRSNGVSENILRQQYYRMQEYLGEYKYQPDPTLKDCVIIDIDGTVAIRGDRGWYDWNKVGCDTPRQFVINMVHGLIDSGLEPIFLSGRDGSCVNETYTWIREYIMKHHISDDMGFYLFMREAGDMRKDYIIKKELFFKYIDGKFNVRGVLDDRKSVLRLWEDLGLSNIINVGDLYSEF